MSSKSLQSREQVLERGFKEYGQNLFETPSEIESFFNILIEIITMEINASKLFLSPVCKFFLYRQENN